ncbi:MAG: hypothetical protein AB1733_03225 [Thermodesulfobacteriota bacterium]
MRRPVTLLILMPLITLIPVGVVCPWSEEVGTVWGLWRLAGVMPAGVVTEDAPSGLGEQHLYWFHEDGTISLLSGATGQGTDRKGRWKQAGNDVTIVWNDGHRDVVKVVRLGENYMILTGFDVRPLWFRFVRYF